MVEWNRGRGCVSSRPWSGPMKVAGGKLRPAGERTHRTTPAPARAPAGRKNPPGPPPSCAPAGAPTPFGPCPVGARLGGASHRLPSFAPPAPSPPSFTPNKEGSWSIQRPSWFIAWLRIEIGNFPGTWSFGPFRSPALRVPDAHQSCRRHPAMREHHPRRDRLEPPQPRSALDGKHAAGGVQQSAGEQRQVHGRTRRARSLLPASKFLLILSSNMANATWVTPGGSAVASPPRTAWPLTSTWATVEPASG